MTLDTLVDGLRNSAKGLAFVAAGLAGSLQASDARAQEPDWLASSAPESVCSERYERMSGYGFEDLSQVTPIGLQDCSSLENYFDEDLSDSTPLVFTLEGGQSYTLGTLRSFSDQSTRGDYILSGPLPSWMNFDSEYGVLDASPSCGDQGVLLEHNIAPGDGPGSINPLFVQYEVSCPSTLSVAGLGVISDSEVTQTGRFDYTLNTSTNEINRAVSVREGRSFIPYDAHVLTNKQDVDVTIQDCVGCYDASADGSFVGVPSYISATGNRLDFLSPDGSQGDSGTLELMVCDSASPGDCSTLFVPWEITDVQAKLAGYSTIGAYDVVTHPNVGGAIDALIDVPCDLGHNGWIIPEEIYKGQGFEGLDLPPGMGVNSNTGEVVWNTDCLSIDYGPGTQVFPAFEYGNSGSLTVPYEVTNPSTTPTRASSKPDYR